MHVEARCRFDYSPLRSRMKTPIPKSNSKTRSTSRNKSNASTARNSALTPKPNTVGRNLVELRGEEVIEEVASEKLEEIVESLVSAVVSTVEAENIKPIASKYSIELLKSEQCFANDRRFSQAEADGKSKKDERDDPKKRLEHILLQSFAAPANAYNPLEKHSRVSKKLTPAVMAKSQPMKNPNNGNPKTRNPIDKPANTSKATRIPNTKNVKDQPILSKSPKPATQPSHQKEAESVDANPPPQAPPRKRAQKELKKDDSKKSIELTGADASKTQSQPAVEEKSHSGSSAVTKAKVPARQPSVGKISVKGGSEKAQETLSTTPKVSRHGIVEPPKGAEGKEKLRPTKPIQKSAVDITSKMASRTHRPTSVTKSTKK